MQFEILDELGVERLLVWSNPSLGLRAFVVFDDLTLGPGVGGVRTKHYDSAEAAVSDAASLARAMTFKCALGGLDAGGAKAVVMDHPGLEREAAFRWLGARIEELGGLFRTSGDLGTTRVDLDAMAENSRFVHANEEDLADAVGRGLVGCIEACMEVLGKPLEGAKVAIQGCGAIGIAVARRLVMRDAELLVADLDEELAAALANETEATVVSPDDILFADVDVLSPCAIGGVITEEVVPKLKAKAICGAANNILSKPEVAVGLRDRGIPFVPDTIASGGGVVEGIGQTVMGLADRGPLIDRLGETARQVLEEAVQTGKTTVEVAEARAWARIKGT